MMRSPGFAVATLGGVAAVLVLAAPPVRSQRALVEQGPPGGRPPPNAGPGLLVVDLADGSSVAFRESLEGRVGGDLDWFAPQTADEALAVATVPDVAAAVAALEGVDGVESAERLVLYGIDGDPAGASSATSPETAFPNDPLFPRQWHLREMGAPAAWGGTLQGRGVVVAVIDTGVTVVEDLDPARVLPGVSFVPGVFTSEDDNGHGTHVAGTIAQWTHNGVGLAGVAPLATLLPVKVLDASGTGSSAAIAAGVDYAADEGADVINLSLGGGYSAVVETAIRKARARGVVVVAAVGNTGERGVQWPGALSEVLGVAAVGPGGAVAPYSSSGVGVDLAAPGGDKRVDGGGVWQDTIDGAGGHAYTALQGTSMAAPHVAGAAAVLLGQGSCDADCVERALLSTASGGGVWDPAVGSGRLNLAAALDRSATRPRRLRFVLAGVASAVVARLAQRGAAFVGVAALVAGVAAGGLWAGVGGGVAQVTASGLLAWPDLALGPGWSTFPLVCSAALPVLAAMVAGDRSWARAVALGLAVGVGTTLLYDAATDAISPWGLPGVLGTGWLALNGTLSWVVGLALAGEERLREETT